MNETSASNARLYLANVLIKLNLAPIRSDVVPHNTSAAPTERKRARRATWMQARSTAVSISFVCYFEHIAGSEQPTLERFYELCTAAVTALIATFREMSLSGDIFQCVCVCFGGRFGLLTSRASDAAKRDLPICVR